MHPINKEWVTPESLRAEADILDKTAQNPRFSLTALADLAGQALSRRRRAQRMVDAIDLREGAEHLAAQRAPHGIATTSNPYGEVRAA